MITDIQVPETASDQLSLLPMPSRAEMERAYLRSDASYDGLFYLGVRTTGIFCRPSCHASCATWRASDSACRLST